MTRDFTDRVLEEWTVAQPDLDASAVGVVHRVMRLARFIDAALADVATRSGLSTKGDSDTLAALRRQAPKHELSPTQLAEAALITTGGMTSRLDRLEQAGMVERHADPNDRRAIVVRLTDAGRRTVDRVHEASLEWQRRLLKALDEGDQAQLADLLRRLLVDLGDE